MLFERTPGRSESFLFLNKMDWWSWGWAVNRKFSTMAERPPFSFVTNPSHHVAGSPFCIFWWTLLFGGLLRRQRQLMHPGASRWSTGQAQRILLVNLSPHWMNYVLWLLLWLLSQGLKPNCLFSFWGSLASNFCFCQWICMNFVFPINSACNNISNFRFV